MKVKLLLTVIVVLAAVLRLYRLAQVPPALYWDEASLGYNAFAIATTLHDEHGVFLPVSNFAAFGDYKPPVYIYATATAVKVLGLSEFSVRVTSALSGILLVLVTFFLVAKLANRKTALLSSFFVAISPWSLQMSRVAFEANLATTLTALGGYFLLRGLRTSRYWSFVVSAAFMVLAMYTFNSHRVFVPFLIVALGLILIRKVLANFKQAIVFGLVFVFLLLPAVPHLTSPEGRLRFNEVTWLNDLSIVETANKLVLENNNALWAKIVYNRRIFYGQIFLEHYFDHFRPDYLFGHGDINPRLSVRSVGEMYWWDAPFVLVGLFFLIKKRNKFSALVLSWILLAPIPAALARETPHALRTLNMLPMPQVVVAVGVTGFFRLLKSPKLLRFLKIGTAAILVFFVFRYLSDYYFVYPKKYDGDWQYGYKQLVQAVRERQDGYDFVSVTGRLGRPYIYFLFYNQYPVAEYLRNRDVSKDNFGFWTVRRFDKYWFDITPQIGKELFVRTPAETPVGTKIIDTIYNQNHEAVFNLY